MEDLTLKAIKVLSIGVLSFLIAIVLTPIVTKFLYKYKFWRKTVRTKSIDGKDLEFFQKFHSNGETNVPRMGGLLIWIPPVLLALIFFHTNLNFISRGQTWLVFFALIIASLVGMIDDVMQVCGRGKYIGGGLSLKYRLGVFALMGAIGGWWIYSKLDWSTIIFIPFLPDLNIGLWIIPLFIAVMMAVYSGGVIDGIDGLAGGAFMSIFGAYSLIAFFNNQIDIAAFCLAIFGSLLAFLWFNIPPARFYMGETGIMGLCASLAIISFLTNSILVLPIIAFLLVIESGSVIIQLASKRFRNKKIFKAAPIHHHFEAIGWPQCKITMRFWVLGVMCAILGVIIKVLG